MKEQKTYMLGYNGIDGKNGLLDPFENITGTSPMDALRKRFNIPLRQVGKEERNPDVILVKAKFNSERNRIEYWGNGAQYCYNRK